MTRRILLILLTLWTVFSLVACATTSGRHDLSKKERAALLLQFGNGALIEGDPTGALATLLQANELAPDMPEIHNSLALVYHAKKDLNEALNEAQIAVKLDPKYADGNNTLGKILLDLGRLNEASKPLITAAQNPLFRESFKAWTNLGILHYRKGEISKASQYFDRAIESARELACVAFYYRGHLKLKNADFSGAIRDYTQASKKSCGGFADAHLAIGITYERASQFELARRTFLEVQQRYPNSKAADQAMNYLKDIP